MTSNARVVRFLALPFLLLAANAAHAQSIDCTELAAIVESADADFAPIRGPLQRSIVPGGAPLPSAPAQATPHTVDRTEAAREFEQRVRSTKFEVRQYATNQPLAGAGSCEIRLMHKDDARATLREATYRCNWPASPGIAALKRSVASCLTDVVMREESAGSLRLYLHHDASGDGERSVHVSVDAVEGQAARLSVTRTVCSSRTAGACAQR